MKSVVICGSAKFKQAAREFADELEKAGLTVYKPFYNTNQEIFKLNPDLKEFAFNGLVRHHMDYIRKADVCFIYNEKGYVGNSTLIEIGFATALNKPIYALEQIISDPLIAVLIDEVIPTAEGLIKKLK